ncbi:MAG TPA: leucyl aminopeptidase [Acidimicrobiales bacterium]|jgi:leucyl aminopeptidase|nr:leucyl aminopeptidase [Acidimicrobiales bacterium]
MAVAFTSGEAPPDGVDALAVPVADDLRPAGRDGGVSAALEAEAGALLDGSFLSAAGFRGEVGQTQWVPAGRRHLVAVGVGPRGSLSRDDLRRAAAALGRAAGRARSVATTLHHAFPAAADAGSAEIAQEAMGSRSAVAAQTVVEGIGLAGYRYQPAAEGAESLLERVTLVGADAAAVRRGEIMVAATLRTRSWVNRPAGDLRPPRLAEMAAEAGLAAGLEVEVWDEGRIAAEGLGCLAGVAAGSEEPPRLVRLTYAPRGAVAHLALVGKGITFDSGGLSIKGASAMESMKADMGGAAAVLAAVLALPDLAPPVRVDAWAAVAENMPSGHATRPGDVLVASDGTTVEVVNTDAEGRLVLADALLAAAGPEPDAIVDVATLTGGQRVALGPQLAAVLGSDDVVERVLAAGAVAGEPAWRLPLWAGYRSRLDSDVADLRNVARDSAASTIMAALFLQRFVAERPWAHLDIAAPSFVDRDDGWLTKGATGWGTRTLIELVSAWA